ncbi:MAG TPA: carboxypeptidase regulatory-like domain-containing protein [Kofleriaceae bacterium]|nr:carboxypeptidase regulatory-like domain-containing protein [Kofleriaceae bacterium]
MRVAPLLLLLVASSASAETIRGAVTFKGKAPERPALDRMSDPVCAKTAKLAEDVVVEGGKLRDVLVRIKVGTAGTHTAPTTPAVITQTECMYTPRVVGVMAGQKLEIRNGDPTFHNVRGTLGKQILWNLAHLSGGEPHVRSDLGKAGDVVSLHCDVHPWMAAWAVMSDHPFFAVTGADGSFELDGVPPGTYTVEAWHPTLGLKSTKVKVKKGKAAKATFSFSSP